MSHQPANGTAAERRAGTLARADVDDLLDTVNRKFVHLRLDRTVAPQEQVDVEDVRHLLPWHAPAIVAALRSDVVEWKLRAVERVRRYLSIDDIAHAIDQVLALGQTAALLDLLRTPNDALQYELCWVLTNICAGSHAQTAAVVAEGAVPVLLHVAANHPNIEVQVQAWWCLGNVAGDSMVLRSMLVLNGIVDALHVFFAARFGAVNSAQARAAMREPHLVHVARISAWLIANLCRGSRPTADWEKLYPVYPLLVDLLSVTDPETVIDACWGMSRILHGISHLPATSAPLNGCKTPTGVTLELCIRFGELLKFQGIDAPPDFDTNRIRTPVLRAITNIASGDDSNSALLLQAGVVPVLCSLTYQGIDLAESSRSVPITAARESLLALSNMAASTDQAVVHAILTAAPVPKLWFDILSNARDPNMDLRVVREALWSLTNATSQQNLRVAVTIVQAAAQNPSAPPPPATLDGPQILEIPPEADWRNVLFDLLLLGIDLANISRENSDLYAEIREKTADALHNLALILAPQGWLQSPYAEALENRVLRCISRRTRLFSRCSALRDLIVSTAAEMNQQAMQGICDQISGIAIE